MKRPAKAKRPKAPPAPAIEMLSAEDPGAMASTALAEADLAVELTAEDAVEAAPAAEEVVAVDPAAVEDEIATAELVDDPVAEPSIVEAGDLEMAAAGETVAVLPMPAARFWGGFLERVSWQRVAAQGVLAAVLVAVLAWGILFSFAERFVMVGPHAPSLVNGERPVISASWPVRWARFTGAQVMLDGEDVSSSIRPVANGFTFQSTRSLAQGRHTVAAVLEYDLILHRKIPVSWQFTVDSVAPAIDFEKFDRMIAARRSWITGVTGRTEPGTKLSTRLEGEAIEAPLVAADGTFTLNLYAISRRSTLVVDAVDRAGNRSRRKLPVVVDAGRPRLTGISPGPGGTTFAAKPRMRLELREPDSYIQTLKLTIDGRSLPVKLTSKTNRLLFQSDLLSDGSHKASLQVADAAGNGWSKKWSFAVDSTKILVRLSERRLYLYKHGKLFRTYPIAVGQPSFPTPQGHWKVVNKRYLPTWTNPHVPWSAGMPEFIGPGPGNPLGTRAIDLSAPGIRFHGTSNTGSVGTAASHGCMRMYMSDVEALFELVAVGTPVNIVP